jgi:hypothetical protein
MNQRDQGIKHKEIENESCNANPPPDPRDLPSKRGSEFDHIPEYRRVATESNEVGHHESQLHFFV